MTAASIAVQVVFPNVDGMPIDEFENTFAFYQADGPDSSGLTPLFSDFYNTVNAGQTYALAAYFNAYVSRATPATIKYYDVTAHLDGSAHGAPFQADNLSATAANAGGSDLPNQDCGVLSYYTTLDAEGDTTKSQRGRIYLGPLNLAATAAGTGGRKLASQFVDDMGIALKYLANGAEALSSGSLLSVWSRKLAAMQAATSSLIYNNVATQRRRAYRPDSRTYLPF